MDKKSALKLIREAPLFWSRLGFCYDPPLRHESGEDIVFNPTFSEADTHRSFTENGVDIHTCILHSGWIGVDKYDYTLCDKVLHEVFERGKAKYFIPRIKLNVPVDWCRENPEEVFVYESGPRERGEIRALVGTLKHDYLGYESEVGYYNANGWQDPRPNVGGLISNQSFSSKKWLEDAGEALRRLVLHLEDSEYGERILAYHVAFGVSGETIVWGRHSGKFGDYGISNQKHFLAWGLQKYGTEQALQEAWGEIAGDVVPPARLREKKPVDTASLYRDPEAERRVVDYDRFIAECNVNAIEHFGKIVKELTGDKPVGAFYGYLIHCARCTYAGHVGRWEHVLESPYIDFIAAPKSYRRSEAGEAGGEMVPACSVNFRKLWVDECDVRTHLATGDAAHSHSGGMEDTECMLLRELCKNLTHHSGLWFMDLGGNWYDDAAIMAFVRRLVEAHKRVSALPYQRTSRVIAVIDEESILHVQPPHNRRVEHLWRNINLAGAPVDMIFSQDIDKMDLSEVELAILLTPYSQEAAYLERLHRAISPRGHVLSFGRSVAYPNLKMKDFMIEDCVDHYFEKSCTQKAICRNFEGNTTVVQAQTGDFLSASLALNVAEIAKIYAVAGVTRIAPAECTVYADNRLIGFFPRENVHFVPDIPAGVIWRDVLTGEALSRGAELVIPARRARAFYIE